MPMPHTFSPAQYEDQQPLEFDSYGQTKQDKNLPNVIFYNDFITDEYASKREGRPVNRDVEMIYIAYPSDRQRDFRAPAHSEWKKVNGRKVTQAMRFPEQYRRFKEMQPQVIEGTSIDEAPFLTMAQRATLRALKVYTVEQLASLSGDNRKNLGQNGLAMQQKAEEYINNASGSAKVLQMAEEIAQLKRSLEAMAKSQGLPPSDPRYQFLEMNDAQLRALIKERTGHGPIGNPSRATMIRTLIEGEAGAGPPDEVAA